MKPYLVDVPVKINIWTRPECQRKQFEVIKQARPSILFVTSDGGRNEREWQLIYQNRKIYDEEIDWDCKVYKLYMDHNLGMYAMGEKRTELIWNTVDRCIMLEDDILPSVSFFQYCAELLEKYKDDERINEKFEPIFNQVLGEEEWLYIVNFYGQLDNDYLLGWKQKYGRVIIDNAQSYFQMPVENTDTLYTCRKYFGVADGAFLYTDTKLNREIPQDESFERMHFLLGRFEHSANEFYSEYVANNKLFASEPTKQMSRLTENLLRGIDYTSVAKKRQDNFVFLDVQFGNMNELKLKSVYGAFMYPLLIQNGAAVRKELQKERIYIPTLWPNVLEECPSNSLEYHYAADILPIPVDQRYEIEDMKYLVEVIKVVSSERT